MALKVVQALCARADANARVLHDWVERTPWIENLAVDPATRSNTSVCLKIVDPAVSRLPEDARYAFIKQLAAILEREDVAKVKSAELQRRVNRALQGDRTRPVY